MATEPTVVIVGAGPAAIAAAHRLRTRSNVTVKLVAPGGVSHFLPGALPIVTGDASLETYSAPVNLDGVRTIPARVTGIEPGRVHLDDGELRAQAVIAAPGLALEPITQAAGSSPGQPNGHVAPTVLPMWDLAGAAQAAPVIKAFKRGIMTVAIAAPFYRCPPAPYGLACRLARRAHDLNLDIQVRLTTPEPRALDAIGAGAPEFLLECCVAAGVEVVFDIRPDLDALADGHIEDGRGTRLRSDLTMVIPPHTAHPLLQDLAAGQPVVPVDAQGRSAATGVYVAGDAASTPYPRATAPAVMSGIAAADGALADLGITIEDPAQTPAPNCFVDQGAGQYRRIQINYPDGPPPNGQPDVELHESASAADGGFDAAAEQWRDSVRVCSATNRFSALNSE